MGKTSSSDNTATLEPTSSNSDPASTLVTPEMEDAFKAVFGDDQPDDSLDVTIQRPTRTERMQAKQEEAESIASLEGADEREDGVEGLLEETPAKEADGEESQKEEEPAEKAETVSKDGEESTLPPVLRHAAKRNGWDDQEIDQLWDSNPDVAERTFQRLHASYSDLSAQFAKLGQAKDDVGSQANKDKKEVEPSNTPNVDFLTQLYGQEKLEEFKNSYGEDFVKDVISPLLKPVDEMYDHYQSQQQQVIFGQVNGFFNDLPEEYHELYGHGEDLSEAQIKNREAVCGLGDQVRSGASLQGLDMAVTEALDRSVSMHSTEHLESINRQKLAKKVRNRSSKITSRPTQRRQSEAEGHSSGRSESKAQEALAARMAELGID